MTSRTQIVCLCEGKQGNSIDPVFINRLIRSLKPNWLRPWSGSNVVRIKPCGGRSSVIKRMPDELRNCIGAGGNTTLMVWADCDEDRDDGNSLREDFWREAKGQEITREQFDRVVFVFAKYRLENWIEYLETGNTDELRKGPRVKHHRNAAEAAKKLAEICKTGKVVERMPPSLDWSCKNWRALAERMSPT